MKRRISSVLVSTAASVLLLEACATSGKTDSETHFVCKADADCRKVGKGSRCANGTCRPTSSSEAGLPIDSDVTSDVRSIGPGSGGTTGAPADLGSPGGERVPSSPSGPPVVDGGQSPSNGGNTAIDASGSGGSSVGTVVTDSGKTSNDPWDQPLASPVTFGGVVTLASGFTVPPGTLRVSLLWRGGLDANGFDPVCGGSRSVAALPTVQSVQGTVTAPGRFSASVDRSPPRVAFHTSPLSGDTIAEAVLVVFVDGNQNDALDLAGPSVASPDLIIGTSSPYDTDQIYGSWPNSDTYRITYSQYYLAGYSPPYVAGYGAYHIHTDAGEIANHAESWPVGSDMTIALGDSMRIRMLTCKQICHDQDTSFVCPAALSNLPTGGRGDCTPAGQERQYYDWYRTTCNGCVCRTATCEYSRDGTTEPPPGWPCTTVDAGPT